MIKGCVFFLAARGDFTDAPLDPSFHLHEDLGFRNVHYDMHVAFGETLDGTPENVPANCWQFANKWGRHYLGVP